MPQDVVPRTTLHLRDMRLTMTHQDEVLVQLPCDRILVISPQDEVPTMLCTDDCPSMIMPKVKVPIPLRTDDCLSSFPRDNGLTMMPQDKPQDEGPPTVHTDEGQTMIKSGFKGKRAKKKFGHTPPQHELQHILSPFTGRTSTGRKLSTMMIICKLSTVVSNALIQKEVALSENQALEKQLSKSKVVVEASTRSRVDPISPMCLLQNKQPTPSSQ